jgi:hypothetical protein
VPQRKENILSELKNKLDGLINDIKDILLGTFRKWLDTHALLSPETWSNKRAEDAIELGISDAYEGMIGEYIRYAINGGEFNQIDNYNEYFYDMLNKANTNKRKFTELFSLFNNYMYVYKNQLKEELFDRGFKEFGQSRGKNFRNQDQAEKWISNQGVNNTDIRDAFNIDDLDSFVEILKNSGREEVILKEFYRNFVFPSWVQYWRNQGISETRKTIENIYKKLEGISSDNIGNSLAVINIALNTCHQTGDMLNYITEETGGNYYKAEQLKAFLDKMTKGEAVTRWEEELREVGVQI